MPSGLSITFEVVVEAVCHIHRTCCNNPPQLGLSVSKVRVPVNPLLDLVMVHQAMVKVAAALEHQDERQFDIHDMIYSVSQQLCLCQATILWSWDAASFRRCLDVPHGKVLVLVLVVPLEEQYVLHVNQIAYCAQFISYGCIWHALFKVSTFDVFSQFYQFRIFFWSFFHLPCG